MAAYSFSELLWALQVLCPVLILDGVCSKSLCFSTFGKITLKCEYLVSSLVFNILNVANLLAGNTYFYLVFGDKSYFCLFSADGMSVALRHSVHVLCHYFQQGNGPLELVNFMSGE